MLLYIALSLALQTPPPPAPPPPPRFMSMKGLPLACFSKPNFEQDGLEFFVCNGGGGIAGVRRQDDRTHTIWVRDFDIAANLNMQLAKTDCSGKRFGVSASAAGIVSFSCDGKALSSQERFKEGAKAQWKKWDTFLK